MIEAMACGTPVVAHALGSVDEVIENGVTGFHTSDLNRMYALVPQAIALDRHRVRERAEERFSAQRMVEAYVNLYRELYARRQS